MGCPDRSRAIGYLRGRSSGGEFGYPVVVKVNSPDILHKTEAGALRIGLTSDDDVRSAYREVVANAESYTPGARIEGVLVGEMVRDATEVIVGVTYDSQLGPVLLFGMGGILVEVMRDVSLRVCPISRLDAEEMVAQVRGSTDSEVNQRLMSKRSSILSCRYPI